MSPSNIASSGNVSAGGLNALKQILYIRDYLDYDTFLKEGDKKKGVKAPLGPATVTVIISDLLEGWKLAVRGLVAQFNSNQQDVTLAAQLFNITPLKGENGVPLIKAYQFSEAALPELDRASDLKAAIAKVKKSRLSAGGKALLIQILYIRDYLDYDTFLKEGNKANHLNSPLGPVTVKTITGNPLEGWKLAVRGLVAQFNSNRDDISAAARIFNITPQINEKGEPIIKAFQFSESPNGLNVPDDSRDLQAALVKIEPPTKEAPATITIDGPDLAKLIGRGREMDLGAHRPKQFSWHLPPDAVPPPSTGTEPASPGSTDLKAIIENEINKLKPGLKRCYESELMRNNSLHGSVVLRFSVNAGSVKKAEIKEDRMNNASVNQCVIAMIKNTTFPESVNGVVEFTFNFEPASGN
ncbi:hypothetical protein A2625_03645 [candidate division WOR-1 bacterium RIFCSPHIGHO2_01_FULL_53_15]|uniref:TonB C-terminal domain-containing protein n=1 Tax=candidate division WOR-1 bacterium RIFCSPHIGHO2_01_FULL_53_15 TaxID=1802564 RepID=A0A1F4Q072_UNCSA|nr:MAG: hypothetical protein A2625_03645 [candidate division WOR-1 bacterium RIFCSPHIGHO2_01_FULL_53_15]OGC10904.1 MAG: hypothetical protein A3D23_06630 [candidate division WOR-1 bacterium RIFCSPHIGHO2_02_FULL_53_26]